MQKLKNIVRTISANPNAMSGTDSTADVERELAVYFEGGWSLFHVEVIGAAVGNVTVLYVLVKDAPDIVPMKMNNIKVEDVLEAEMKQTAKRGRPAKNVEVPVTA